MRKANHSLDLTLMSLPMMALMSAQFLSAMADNALLIAAIALVKVVHRSDLIPWLQESFILPYILLAPFAGPIADSFSKGRVMFGGNAIKFLGAGLILTGFNPLAGYALVGVGATVYSPAKYGILLQLFDSKKLVCANSMLESSTIAAILIGVMTGGILADRSIHLALVTVAVLYVFAAGANLLIPRLPPEHLTLRTNPLVLIRDFLRELIFLSDHRDARFSLMGTSIFWGAGSALRLLLFAWVPIALGIIGNETPSKLMASLSIGIVIGAFVAGKFISLRHVNRAMAGGLLIGPLVAALSATTDMTVAVIVTLLIGACGGAFVVPLNALLQKCGHDSVGAGYSLAVQNLFENVSILLFVGFCAGMKNIGVGVIPTVKTLGIMLFTALAALLIWRMRNPINPINIIEKIEDL